MKDDISRSPQRRPASALSVPASVAESNGAPRGFRTKRDASDYWHDTRPGVNDHARFVKDAGRWFIEVRRGWDWIRRDWYEYVKARPAYAEVSTITEYGLTQRLSFAVRCF